jgi:mevalonate kinase
MEGKEKLQPLMKCINAVLAIYGKRVGLNIQISSDIPVAAGLGSSAATAVSLAAGLSELLELGLSKEVINRLAYESEVMIHYTPSGVDNTISTYGGLLRYNKGWKNKIRRLRIKYDIPLLIADTGRPRNTGVQVSIVRSIYNNFPKLFLEILRVYDKIYRNAINAIKKRDLKELGLLMNINQGLLSAVGVSSIELDILVNIALDRGAYGAKLTGAGGGGCMITLVDKDRAHDLEKSISKYCKEVLFVSTDNKGVTAKIVK